MTAPSDLDARKHLLEAGVRLAARPDGFASMTAGSLAQEAGVGEQAFTESFATLERYRRELLLHLMDVVRVAVLKAAAGIERPGLERMWRCVEAYLDTNLRLPAMRKLAQGLHADPLAIELLRRRTGGYAMVFKVELAAMGQQNPAAAARLGTAMIVEAAVAESEAGHAVPDMRRALYAFLKGYCL